VCNVPSPTMKGTSTVIDAAIGKAREWKYAYSCREISGFAGAELPLQ